MGETGLLPKLFRTEYQKIVSVLLYLFGLEHIEIAEDIASDTFLSATETWSAKGLPENPTAWLYTVAKNKTKNYLKRHSLFENKLTPEIRHSAPKAEDMEIDLSVKNIADSQLAMIFVVCDPVVSVDAQVALALNLLCGFSVQEIADAFLTNTEVVYKRINRARQKLKEENIKIEQPSLAHIAERLDSVLKTIYLLFSEGYYSSSQNTSLRKDLCEEAMRLAYLLIGNESTNKPEVNALLALMCFHASRFDARLNDHGDMILYQDQDERLWDKELVKAGEYFLHHSSDKKRPTKYDLEAGIAYWHTHKEDSAEKWENILLLYNNLLLLEYSPIAALNRTYALAKARGKKAAIIEAEKLRLNENHFYYSLLGYLYTDIDNEKAILNYREAEKLATTTSDKNIIRQNIEKLGRLSIS